MNIRLALKIMKMSKAAIQKKWGKAGLSKVVQARLLLKKQGKDIGKIARQASKSKKGSPRGLAQMARKTESPRKRG